MSKYYLTFNNYPDNYEEEAKIYNSLVELDYDNIGYNNYDDMCLERGAKNKKIYKNVIIKKGRKHNGKIQFERFFKFLYVDENNIGFWNKVFEIEDGKFTNLYSKKVQAQNEKERWYIKTDSNEFNYIFNRFYSDLINNKLEFMVDNVFFKKIYNNLVLVLYAYDSHNKGYFKSNECITRIKEELSVYDNFRELATYYKKAYKYSDSKKGKSKWKI
jgi:hypothetical protein